MSAQQDRELLAAMSGGVTEGVIDGNPLAAWTDHRPDPQVGDEVVLRGIVTQRSTDSLGRDIVQVTAGPESYWFARADQAEPAPVMRTGGRHAHGGGGDPVRLRPALYTTAKLLGDVNAVRKRTVARRIGRRIAGKATGRLLGRIFG